MYHCLNKRRGNTYETQENDTSDLPEKLQKRYQGKQKKYPSYPDAWRRPSLNKDGKK